VRPPRAFIELTWGGQEPGRGGRQRTFLEDADEVVLSATAPRPEGTRIGFGEAGDASAPAIRGRDGQGPRHGHRRGRRYPVGCDHRWRLRPLQHWSARCGKRGELSSGSPNGNTPGSRKAALWSCRWPDSRRNAPRARGIVVTPTNTIQCVVPGQTVCGRARASFSEKNDLRGPEQSVRGSSPLTSTITAGQRPFSRSERMASGRIYAAFVRPTHGGSSRWLVVSCEGRRTRVAGSGAWLRPQPSSTTVLTQRSKR